jgi:hypothetical protein
MKSQVHSHATFSQITHLKCVCVHTCERVCAQCACVCTQLCAQLSQHTLTERIWAHLCVCVRVYAHIHRRTHDVTLRTPKERPGTLSGPHAQPPMPRLPHMLRISQPPAHPHSHTDFSRERLIWPAPVLSSPFREGTKVVRDPREWQPAQVAAGEGVRGGSVTVHMRLHARTHVYTHGIRRR